MDLIKRSELTRGLDNAEQDSNLTAIETHINGILAGTAGYEAGNAIKLAGLTFAQIFAAPVWINATLENSWTVYGTSTPQYFKDILGFVHIRGLVNGGTTGSNIFTLPAGYRPSATVVVPTDMNGGSYGRLVISTTGTVIVAGASGITSIHVIF